MKQPKSLSAGLKRHPLSEAWGNMNEEERKALQDDIKANGILDPYIVMLGNEVLDGWHRYSAASKLDLLHELQPQYIEEDDAVARVISANFHRRHSDIKLRVRQAYDLLEASGLKEPPSVRRVAKLAGVSPSTAARHAPKKDKQPTKKQRAMESIEAHPDWTDQRVADELGVARGTVIGARRQLEKQSDTLFPPAPESVKASQIEHPDSPTWQVEENDAMTFLRNLPDDHAGLVIADPPYDENEIDSEHLRQHHKKDANTASFNLRAFTRECIRVTKGNGIIFTGKRHFSFIWQTIYEAGLTPRLVIWAKNNPSPYNAERRYQSSAELLIVWSKPKAPFNEYQRSSVLHYNAGKSKPHPTTKNTALIRELVQVLADPGDLVVDPTCGSGTTGIAAKQAGRSFLGVDIKAEYVALARKRIEDAPPVDAEDVGLSPSYIELRKGLKESLNAEAKAASRERDLASKVASLQSELNDLQQSESDKLKSLRSEIDGLRRSCNTNLAVAKRADFKADKMKRFIKKQGLWEDYKAE